MQRTRVAFSCFALVGLVCLTFFLHQALLKPEAIEAVSASESEFQSSANTINLAFDVEKPVLNRTEVVAESFEPTQVENTLHSSDVEVESYENRPSTVELTEFRGEMKKGKLATKPFVDIATHPSLPWFTKDASRIVFPESQESKKRDYFFAWVQLNPNHLHSLNNHSFQALQVELFDSGNEYRRALLPRDPEVLKKLLDHDAVLALGNKPIEEKMGPNFRKEIAMSAPGATRDVLITLMTTENLAHWQQQIKNLGADIQHWDPTIRVVVAKVPYGKLVDLAEWDFVQSIEPVGTLELTLDSAVSVAGADGIRTHLGVNGSFSGITGEGITIGVMDSGLNLSHPDISATRDSICGESFEVMSNGQLDTDDLWFDVSGHGTHVTSIFAGAGVDNRSRAGVAPGVKHIRFAKVFSKDSPSASMSASLKAMDYFTTESSCEWNGIESAGRKPNVINVSLSIIAADAGYFTDAKKLDWAVWNHNQVYAVSQGNSRTSGYSHYGSAKNALPVGWLTDALFANFSSSFGPTSDERMVPKVSMSGDNVLAADGEGAEFGYTLKSGTSMSSPAVAGIAALLMDTDDGFKNNPALVRAQLMATAIKPDAYFDDEAYAPRTSTHGTGSINNQYGMGSVSARTAIVQGPNDEWSSHSAVSEIENDDYAYIEIDVPEDTDRLDIVLTWDEPANDNVGSAVMADLDLYLGPDEDCDVTECGEYVSSSRVDNLEYLIISNPEAGTKRITVIPHNIFQFAPRIAVSYMFIGKSTPQLDIELDSDTLNTANTRRPRLELTVSTDEFVAGGVSLFFACREADPGDCAYWNDTDDSRWQPGSQVKREDGTVQDLTGIYIGNPVFIGELVSNEAQDVTLVFPPTIKRGSHQLYVSAASANANSDVDAVNVEVDGDDLPPFSTTIVSNYANTAIELTGDSGTVAVDLAAGAQQPGESEIDFNVMLNFFIRRVFSATQVINFAEGYDQSRSAWYKLRVDTASKYGIQITNQSPSNANVSFQLLTEDAMFDPLPGNMWITDEHEFYLQPDKEYYLRVTSYEVPRVPELEFTWQRLDTRPVNDQFADRIELTGESGNITGNNAYATVEKGEPGGHVSVGTTWFKWVAPSNGVWTFDADAPFSNQSPQVYVFRGSSIDDLQLISDTSYATADVPVVADQEYQVCVSSNAQRFTNFQGSYELSWEEGSSSSLMSHDMFDDAISISGSQGSRTKCNPCSGDRTVEIDEPSETNSHSLWWAWEAPSTDNFTFRIRNALVDTLSVFSGSELNDLTLEASGPEFVLSATSGETYYISLHRNSGLDYSRNLSNNSFQWGVTPEYDSISTPITLSGTAGTLNMETFYATTTPDESQANGVTSTGVRSSVWGSWSTPANFDGWMRFSTETWEVANLQSARDQYYLGIHERDEANDRWDLIASTDRSFIISGKPIAVFQPEDGKDYRVQVAVRSNNTTLSTSQARVEVSWRATTTPSWITSDEHFYEFGSPSGNNIEELIDPTSGVVVGRDLDKLLLNVEDEMLVLELSDGMDDLDVIESIPYTNADGETITVSNVSVVGWNPARRVLYAPAEEGFAVFEGFDQSSREFSRCDVVNDFEQVPTQIVHEGTGRYLYKIAEDTIAAYRVDGPCELTIVQVVTASLTPHQVKTQLLELDGLRSVAFGPGETFMYGLSNDRIFGFAKDSETGELSVVSNTLHSEWLDNTRVNNSSNRFDGASVALHPSGDYLFAVGRNDPSVALFDLATDRTTPTSIAALDGYYLEQALVGQSKFFPTHIRGPHEWNDFRISQFRCRINSVHITEDPTIEVFCSYVIFNRYVNFALVVTFDRGTGEFFISDWSSDEQPDRFGNQFPLFGDVTDVFGVSSSDGQFSYVVVEDWIDSIHRFERLTGANSSFPKAEFELYDEYLLRLVAMNVESGSIKLGSQNYTDCQVMSNTTIDDVSYTVLNSEWQVRNAIGEEWLTVIGTARTDNQLCPYDPTDARDYRMVFEATIDGVTDKYSSDVMVELPNSN